MNTLLKVENLQAYYGKSHILHGVNLTVHAGEVVALLGRNGVGRSTMLKAIMGLVAAQGNISFKDQAILGLKTFQIAMAGIGYVPENRAIFADLTVEENLLLGQKASINNATMWQCEDVFALFPILKERLHTRAGVLSGGEQQMLSLSRSVLGNPELILIDEPTEGLAPQVVAQLERFFLRLKERGVAILLVEQKLQLALKVADRFVLMGQGREVFVGDKHQFLENDSLRNEWLAV